MKHPLTSARSLRRIATGIALVLIPVFFVAIFVSVRSEFAEVRELRSVAEETGRTRDELSQLLIMHVDAETAVRGFVISNDERFLQPYLAAIDRRDSAFALLEERSDPQVKEQLPALRRLSDAKLANARRNIANVRDGRADLARERIANGTGKRMMDQIRQRIAGLDRIEMARLRQASKAGTGSRDDVERTVMALLVGLGVLMLGLTLLVSASHRARQEALVRARKLGERNSAMFDGAVDGMLLLDERGTMIRFNPSISRMFGYDAAELAGQHNMFLMADEFSDEESRAWLGSVGAAGTHGAGKRHEFIGKRKDGSIFETEVAISRLSAGDERRYIAAIRDISHRKRAERMKTEFVSTVSHELRTPLTSIGGSLGLLEAGAAGNLTDQAMRLVAIAHSNCQRLIRLINDILDIEKIESGRMEFNLRRMQVGPLINRTLSSIAGFAEKHDVALHAYLPPWPQCVMGDADRIEQLLTNLVSNAIKHSPTGGRVEVRTNHLLDRIRIEVRDRGEGIPEDFRSRIFGKFAMADASDNRAKDGTGLGLSIAREIARKHGGEIGFEDRNGGGTIFFCELPALATDGSLDVFSSDSDLPVILHLDDDDDCLSVIASAFAGKALLQSAASLFEARALLDKRRIDAAIVDVILEGEEGTDLIAELRASDPQLPIVLFTALDNAQVSHDADRVVVKSRMPVSELVGTVLALIERQRKAA